MAGRGWGKTRTLVEWLRYKIETGARRIAIVARTPYDARDVLVEGESGIMATARPGNRPRYEPSKRRLTWPNGAQATTYSSQEPDQLRGPQHEVAIGDEVAAWDSVETLSNLMLGLRVGPHPQVAFGTTPKATKVMKELLALPQLKLTRGRTYDNLDNLSPLFRERILARYEGTRLGRQELEGELVLDVEGALWTLDLIDNTRAPLPARADLQRVVIAIDPAVSASEDSDETGIIVAGLGYDKGVYILDDLSGRLTPDAWARRVCLAYDQWGADRVIAEINQGGQMVEHTLRTVAPGIAYRGVHAKKGKYLRAEPVSALYEQVRVHHTAVFDELERQMSSWAPGDSDSPDRLDALVYAVTELVLAGKVISMAW